MNLEFLDHVYFGATVAAYIRFGVILILTLLLRKPLARLIVRVFASLAERWSKGEYYKAFCSMLHAPLSALFLIAGLFTAFNQVERATSKIYLFRFSHQDGKPPTELLLSRALREVFLFLAIVAVARLMSEVSSFLFRSSLEHARKNHQTIRLQVLPLLKQITRFLIGVFALLWILGAVFQVNVPALVAGIGIGGVAIALAAKETVENLFASMTILMEKPFQVGDMIKVDQLEGRVERIGFRSTQLRHDDGQLLVTPNKKLVDQSLQNLTQRTLRGIHLYLPIKYGTLPEQLATYEKEISRALHSLPVVGDSVKVKTEPLNDASLQLHVSFRIPMSYKESPDALRELAYFRAYAVVHGTEPSEAISRPNTTAEGEPDKNS